MSRTPRQNPYFKHRGVSVYTTAGVYRFTRPSTGERVVVGQRAGGKREAMRLIDEDLSAGSIRRVANPMTKIRSAVHFNAPKGFTVGITPDGRTLAWRAKDADGNKVYDSAGNLNGPYVDVTDLGPDTFSALGYEYNKGFGITRAQADQIREETLRRLGAKTNPRSRKNPPFTGRGFDESMAWGKAAKAGPVLPVSQARAKQIIEDARKRASWGHYSDQLERVMEPGEYRFIHDLWLTLPGRYSFTTTLESVANGQTKVNPNPAAIDVAEAALRPYGASLTPDGFIQKNGKVLSVQVVVSGKRLRMEGVSGRPLASGPITEKFVQSFVEGFWFWKKRKANPRRSRSNPTDFEAIERMEREIKAANEHLRQARLHVFDDPAVLNREVAAGKVCLSRARAALKQVARPEEQLYKKYAKQIRTASTHLKNTAPL